MKKSNQLVLESGVIGVLFVLTVVGGSLAGLSQPRGSTVLSDPANVAATHDPDALSLLQHDALPARRRGVRQCFPSSSCFSIRERISEGEPNGAAGKLGDGGDERLDQ